MNDPKFVRRNPIIQPENTPRSFGMLVALNRLNKQMYAGTVTAAVKAKRRARGKVAKASRKANRP